MLIEIHMIQNHAPSNLNRDDTGSPKECTFGAVPRARISSQCLKRSIRKSPLFEGALAGHLGTRTRRLPQLVGEALAKLSAAETEINDITAKAAQLGSDKAGAETRQLIFLNDAEVEKLAKAMLDLYRDDPKAFNGKKDADFKDVVDRTGAPRSVDVALFGRMTTSAAFQDVEASIQVAHAFSTTALDRQFDYFTAVDDLVQGTSDDLGAGMIGDVEFNSAPFYKYFSLDWDDLLKNVAGDHKVARDTVAAVLRAAALSNPSGKQNGFAAHNPPDAILVETKREKAAVSYANAFVKPIQPTHDIDVVQASKAALVSYAARLRKAYSLNPSAALWLDITGDTPADGTTKVDSLDDLIAGVLATLPSGDPS